MNQASYPGISAPGAPQAAPKRYDGRDGVPQYDEKHGGHYGEDESEEVVVVVIVVFNR